MRRKKKRSEIEKSPPMRRLPRYWDAFRGGRYDASFEVDTAVAAGDAGGRRRSARQLSATDFTSIRK